ncbi:hypothetical protein P7G51_07900 [Enterococcus asini]|uniref:hypothetical protein n=1 Tax=Enterococcus asini TaxID=57732 RepID=UPI00288EAEAC|nr:hypothetical protein [Enterococcus asini]MDT2757301.1 hypothetical protein [Enterococcus asini]
MGLFQRLFGKKPAETEPEITRLTPTPAVAVEEYADWEEVPFYVESEPSERELVALIATAIAAGEAPKSEFQVKKVLSKNPEAKKVALIATAIAAGDAPNSQFQVKKIYQKK